MHPFKLPNGAVILDDTYNASPASTIAALELLGGFKGRRIAVLGDMLELGQYEVAGHQSVGGFAVSTADLLILVGERSKITAESALGLGFPADNLFWFADFSQATELLLTKIQKDDVVLVKGSNSMRMDRIITSIKEMF
jgi:UDP-N-acetylmuramoyl-tripeptide--D-alanyl-D-alanine ligase